MAGAARQADTKADRNGFSREFYVVHIAAEAVPTVLFGCFVAGSQE